MLLDGHLTLSAARQAQFFRPWLAGPHHGRLVLAFTWPWPAVLAASEALFGSMLVALGLSAAGATVACYMFARELVHDHARALLAAALVTLSPLVLTLSGTYLNYVSMLALELTFGWMMLRGIRTGSWRWFTSAGAVWALAAFTRPYDGLLVAIPFAMLLAASSRTRGRELLAPVASLAAGAAPILALTVAANIATDGSPFTFPTSTQSHGAARFFWGYRDVVPGTRGIHFTLLKAFSSLGKNLWALPTWLLGTYLLLGLAAYGATRLWARQRRELWLLLGIMAVFPIGYLAWFASAITVPGALSGIGPHYYLPMVPPIAILAACGVFTVWEKRRAWVAGSAALAVGITAIALPPKLADKRNATRFAREYSRQVHEGLRRRGSRDALVVLEHTWYPNVMGTFEFLANPPDLDSPVLYAIDRGAAEADLLRRYPDRAAFKVVERFQPGADIGRVSLVLKPLGVVNATLVALHARIVNPSGKPTVVAYLREGHRRTRWVLDTASAKGRVYDVAWTLSADGRITFDGASRQRLDSPIHLPRSGQLDVGASFSASVGTHDPDRAERRYAYRRVPTATVEILTADVEWVRFGAPTSTWLPIALAGTLDVNLQPSPSARR